MKLTCDYRDPDISLNMLAASLCTNRTTLSCALHELGYVSFSAYINSLRIEEFIQRVRSKESTNYEGTEKVLPSGNALKLIGTYQVEYFDMCRFFK